MSYICASGKWTLWGKSCGIQIPHLTQFGCMNQTLPVPILLPRFIFSRYDLGLPLNIVTSILFNQLLKPLSLLTCMCIYANHHHHDATLKYIHLHRVKFTQMQLPFHEKLLDIFRCACTLFLSLPLICTLLHTFIFLDKNRTNRLTNTYIGYTHK